MKKTTLAGAGAAITSSGSISETLSSPVILNGKDDRIVSLGFIGVGGMGTNLLRSCLVCSDSLI